MGIERRWARMVLGLFLGVLMVPVELAVVIVGGLVAIVAPARPAVLNAARALTDFALWRIGARIEYPRSRAPGYLAVRWLTGVLGGLVLFLLFWEVAAGVAFTVGWLVGDYPDGIAPTGWVILYFAVAGSVFAFLVVQGIVGVVSTERKLAHRVLGPSQRDVFEQRISALAASRAEVVAAVDDERRRIERDLHDGVQQRLVALGMLIGRTRRAQGARQPEKVEELLRQAHDEAQHALNELREVAWRVYPTMLDDQGLPAALEAVAERAALPVRLEYTVAGALGRAVETAVYFVVREAVTNAVKHSGATEIRVLLASPQGKITVSVEDDGVGGADLNGSGLGGLARRVTALDGQLHVDSPVGGPTRVMAELPCA
jgi:signal transduction histidine kinase